MTNWYAVYTRPRNEEKVAEGFTRRKLENYCPLKDVTRQWMGAKLVKTPLFPSYVFVRLTEAQLPEAKKMDGVINIVYWLGKPAVIRDVEIEMVRRFLAVHKEVRLEKAPVNTTEMVTLTNGTRVQKEGTVVAVDAVGPQLFLPSLGYRLIASQHTMQQSFTPQVIPARQEPLVNFG
jgi:transcription antitermination factor NusG